MRRTNRAAFTGRECHFLKEYEAAAFCGRWCVNLRLISEAAIA
jgi:hypothetical protein